MAVVVVTDSSSGLSEEECLRWAIRRVPLHILIDGLDLRDGVDDIPRDIYNLPDVTTAGAAPAELECEYRKALQDSGGDGVLAVHISGALSSTITAATQVAKDFGMSLRVVNSRSAAKGTGFVALAAAQAAEQGADLNSVETAAQSAVARSHGYIVVHRLDNLRRGGRIGTAASWLGTALSLKPLLCLDAEGRLVLSQRVRTASKAFAAMVEQVAELASDREVKIAVQHVDNPVAAADVAEALWVKLPGPAAPPVTAMGPVLAVHVGAGAVGVSLDVGGRR
ncbi:MAG: DegV family protein [Mycobacterium sp.]